MTHRAARVRLATGASFFLATLLLAFLAGGQAAGADTSASSVQLASCDVQAVNYDAILAGSGYESTVVNAVPDQHCDVPGTTGCDEQIASVGAVSLATESETGDLDIDCNPDAETACTGQVFLYDAILAGSGYESVAVNGDQDSSCGDPARLTCDESVGIYDAILAGSGYESAFALGTNATPCLLGTELAAD